LRFFFFSGAPHAPPEFHKAIKQNVPFLFFRALGRVVDTMGVGTRSDAEAASIALQLLAAERRFAGAIEATGVGVVGGTFLIAGLLALQTQFEFVRDKDGRGAVKIKKKPTSGAMLKLLEDNRPAVLVTNWGKWGLWGRPMRWQGL
jgi:hypothetical protein